MQVSSHRGSLTERSEKRAWRYLPCWFLSLGPAPGWEARRKTIDALKTSPFPAGETVLRAKWRQPWSRRGEAEATLLAASLWNKVARTAAPLANGIVFMGGDHQMQHSNTLLRHYPPSPQHPSTWPWTCPPLRTIPGAVIRPTVRSRHTWQPPLRVLSRGLPIQKSILEPLLSKMVKHKPW